MNRIATCLLAGTFQATLAVSAYAADIELRLAHVTAESSPIQSASLEFAKRVRERTDGAVNITIFAGAQLGSYAEVYEQIKLSAPIIQIADPGYLSDFTPDFGVLAGPYLLDDPLQFKPVFPLASLPGLFCRSSL
jgi:TRAP-type C4-dicarboxylate transport system substrate-binding protein